MRTTPGRSPRNVSPAACQGFVIGLIPRKPQPLRHDEGARDKGLPHTAPPLAEDHREGQGQGSLAPLARTRPWPRLSRTRASPAPGVGRGNRLRPWRPFPDERTGAVSLGKKIFLPARGLHRSWDPDPGQSWGGAASGFCGEPCSLGLEAWRGAQRHFRPAQNCEGRGKMSRRGLDTFAWMKSDILNRRWPMLRGAGMSSQMHWNRRRSTGARAAGNFSASQLTSEPLTSTQASA